MSNENSTIRVVVPMDTRRALREAASQNNCSVEVYCNYVLVKHLTEEQFLEKLPDNDRTSVEGFEELYEGV